MTQCCAVGVLPLPRQCSVHYTYCSTSDSYTTGPESQLYLILQQAKAAMETPPEPNNSPTLVVLHPWSAKGRHQHGGVSERKYSCPLPVAFVPVRSPHLYVMYLRSNMADTRYCRRSSSAPDLTLLISWLSIRATAITVKSSLHSISGLRHLPSEVFLIRALKHRRYHGQSPTISEAEFLGHCQTFPLAPNLHPLHLPYTYRQ